MGAELPSGLDGKVLSEAFEESFVARHEVRMRPADGDTVHRDADIYSPEEAQRLVESLSGLGYID
jgi:hypothetical protein